MRAAPKLFFVPMPISPSLLAVTHAPRLLLPKTLWDRLSDAQQQTLLVHELAHLRRRDHWVRRLELVALCLYWWFPVMWYARRALHEAEELCCDAWVVWTLPESSQCYAETLVETLAFLAESRNAVPLGASGIKNTKSMKRRLTMILKQNTSRSLPLVGLLLVLLLAAAVLPLYPTAAQTVAGPDEVPTANQATNESEATPEKFSPTKADPSSARQNKTKEDNGGARAESENDSYGEETYGPPITAIPQARIAEAKDKLELAKLQVELLKAELRQVLVLLDQANAEYKRLRVLADKNVVTAKELLAASYEAKVVQAKVEAKEVALRQSELLFAQAQRRYEELLAAGKSKTPPDAAPIKSSGKKSSPAQVTAAKKAYEIFLKAFMAGELKDVEKCYLWSRRWLQAEMALSKKQSKRKAALHSHAGRMVALQEIIQDMAQAGAATGVDLAAAEYYVVEARQWLAESK